MAVIETYLKNLIYAQHILESSQREQAEVIYIVICFSI